MKNLVIGLGEVGTAIKNILECEGYDISMSATPLPTVDIIHICFPYTAKFTELVEEYKSFCNATIVVVHSTVPVGTCDKYGWVHSPVRGVHPNLEEGIRTFVKYIGCKDGIISNKIAVEFQKFGLNTFTCENAKTTEALKLWDTTQYGLMIILEKEIHRWCEKNEVDPFVVYELANMSYNQGYKDLGKPEVVRPHLKHMPGKIGGHCVIQNAKLLDSVIALDLIEINEQYK